MPKIAADTVAEHVAQQEAAVIRGATKLFRERGVGAVTLGDIAAEVGLARNSLYRYFPDKGHILAAWFRTELGPLREASAAIAASDASALDRLHDWLALQLDYLTAPEHQAMIAATAELQSVADDVRRDIAEGHQALYDTLQSIVADAMPRARPSAKRDPHAATMLIIGCLRAATDLVVAGTPRKTVETKLGKAAVALVS